MSASSTHSMLGEMALLLLLLLSAVSASAHGDDDHHNCVHDTEEMQRLIYGVRNGTAITKDGHPWHTLPLDKHAQPLFEPTTTTTTTTSAPRMSAAETVRRAFLRRFHDRIRAETPAITIAEDGNTHDQIAVTIHNGADDAEGVSVDDHEGQQRAMRAMSDGDLSEGVVAKARFMRPQARQSMRFVIKTVDLDDSSKYCETSSSTEIAPDFKGANYQCSADWQFTSARRNVLLNEVIPDAIAMLSNVLKVTRETANVKAPSSCGFHTMPAADKTTGTPNADFVLYLAAGPVTGSTVAWAGYCSLNAAGRPIVGRANFNPKYLTITSVQDRRKIVRTGVHEILHALGFSNSYWTSSSYLTSAPLLTGGTRRGGQPVTIFKTPTVVAKARAFFNCPTLSGPEIEDEGGAGTMGSHWERRSHLQDVMAGINGNDMYFSAVTMALLEDSGHYDVDYTKSEDAPWGYKAGCGFHDSKCNTVAGGVGKFFCADTTGAKGCTFDNTAIGYCHTATYISALPSWGQYFSDKVTAGGAQLLDYCPIVAGYSNRQCADGTQTSDAVQGYFFGSGGRCMATVGDVVMKPYTMTGSGEARCLQTRCPDNGARIEFKVGNTGWIACPTDGTALTISLDSYNYRGSVVCPTALSFCGPDINIPATLTATTTTKPPTTATTTTKPPTTTTTTKPPTTTTTTKPPTTTTKPPTTTTTKAPTTTTTTKAPTTTTTKAPTTTPTTKPPTTTTTTKPPTTTTKPPTTTTTKAPTTTPTTKPPTTTTTTKPPTTTPKP